MELVIMWLHCNGNEWKYRDLTSENAVEFCTNIVTVTTHGQMQTDKQLELPDESTTSICKPFIWL